MNHGDLKTSYGESYALVIGINDYAKASPLMYALNDARAFGELLLNAFGFKSENVIRLSNAEATKSTILEAYMSFTDNRISDDDRICVFFAGHGHTVRSYRADVGFLVPYDGNVDKLGTLVRWDDLTKNAELIPAKHMLFIMDACYGGLAIQRALKPGSMRFLRDNYRRVGRQVLTAGKADEVVSDTGGPLPNHSVFTGHLIEGLGGKSASSDGVMTANGLMAYVYEKVARDPESKQTPHFGYISGDGDFVFSAPILEAIKESAKEEEDILVTVPTSGSGIFSNGERTIEELAKDHLSNPSGKIYLDELTTRVTRHVIELAGSDEFSTQSPFSDEELVRRIERYEAITGDFQKVVGSIAYWGGNEHASILKKGFGRLTDPIGVAAGLRVWIGLRWFPIEYLLYFCGMASIAAENYDNLSAMFLTHIAEDESRRNMGPLLIPTTENIVSLNDTFKRLPGHERNYVPKSEYFHKKLQPSLDDLLFLGRDYERVFDRFELLRALVYADLTSDQRGNIWGPIGRFGWKQLNGGENSPLNVLRSESKELQNQWGPIKAGLFRGKYSRFEEIANGFTELLKQLRWF